MNTKKKRKRPEFRIYTKGEEGRKVEQKRIVGEEEKLLQMCL